MTDSRVRSQVDGVNDQSPVAVVTGSSSGIGQAIAEELARSGFNILVHFLNNESGAEQTRRRVEAHGQVAIVVQADLSDETDRQKLFDKTNAWCGCPHALINNAGADVLTGDAQQLSFADKLELLWRTDVQATMFLSRCFAERMKSMMAAKPPHPGLPTIVNMGWDQADIGMEADSGEMFGVIKGAVMAFTKAFAKSCAPVIRVNAVAPGWIQTKWGDQTGDYWDNRAVSESLLGRWGKPEDVAGAVGFLCSPAAAFINGHVLPVNGGFAGRAVDQSKPAK